MYRFQLTAGVSPTRDMRALYDFGPMLGRGGFGAVYKALYCQTGKWYAIKVLEERDQIGGRRLDSRKFESFLKEITILETLAHRNICQLREFFIEKRNISAYLHLRCS